MSEEVASDRILRLQILNMTSEADLDKRLEEAQKILDWVTEGEGES